RDGGGRRHHHPPPRRRHRPPTVARRRGRTRRGAGAARRQGRPRPGRDPQPGRAGPVRGFSLLVNPAAGGGAAPAAVLPVAGLLRAAGATVEVTYSPGPAATADL